jgi:hypothetical protein
MRRFTLLALLAIITAPAFGYGSYSTEKLNDNLYVDIFCETYEIDIDDEAEIARVLEGYDITIDEFEAYTTELFDDPIRTEAVSMALTERDEWAGWTFDITVAFSELDDLDWENIESWRYFSSGVSAIPDDWDSFSDGEKQGWFAQEFAALREQFLEWQQEVMSQDTVEE